MNSEFVEKRNLTGKEYLAASLEDVIDRANKSSNQSEIPFVTALLAAKSHENLRKTSNRMFYVAIVTTVIAVLSLVQSYYSSIGNAALERELVEISDKISSQEKKIIELQIKITSTDSKIESLRKQKEENLAIIEDPTNNEIKHNKSIQLTAKAAD
jgi:uncharacterized protein YlxW (UPF0749 family)